MGGLCTLTEGSGAPRVTRFQGFVESFEVHCLRWQSKLTELHVDEAYICVKNVVVHLGYCLIQYSRNLILLGTLVDGTLCETSLRSRESLALAFSSETPLLVENA